MIELEAENVALPERAPSASRAWDRGDSGPWLRLVMLMTVVATLARFVGLQTSPPGFFSDEAANGAHIIAVRETGRDAVGQAWPLFSPVLAGGYTTPTFLYGGVAWTSVFGDSFAAYRSMVAFFGAMTVVGVFLLARTLFRRTDVAWMAALCAAVSPWAFIFSRIAWDPPLAPAFYVWSLYLLMRGGRHALPEAAAAGVLAALACYSYPTMRLQAMLTLPLFFWLIPGQGRGKWLRIGAFVLAAGIVMIPLVRLTFTGEIQGRFNYVSIGNEEHLRRVYGDASTVHVVQAFVKNVWLMFSPTFLFVWGDENIRHSTRHVGLWSWLDILAVAGAVVLVVARRLWQDSGQRRVVGVLVGGYVLAILPTCLTWEGIPHALRPIGAYPFLSLFAGFALMAAGRAWRPMLYLAASVAAAFSLYFSVDYFTEYPRRAVIGFDVPVVDAIRDAEREGRLRELPEYLLGRGIRYNPLAISFYQWRDRAAKDRATADHRRGL